MNADFSVSGFQRRNHRQVKDKKNCFYVESVKAKIMEGQTVYKNSEEIREYWKLHKRKQRAEARKNEKA